MKKITIIIPTYNRQFFLKRAVESILVQSDPDFEILVCDNGSTDNSYNLIKNFRTDKLVWIDGALLPKDPGAMKNLGIKHHSGEFVCFLDSDDFYQGPYLAWVRKQLEEKDFVCESSNKKFGKYPRFINYEDLALRNSVIASSVAMKSSLIEKAGFFPVKSSYSIYEDYAYWLRVGLIGKIYQVPPLFIRREKNNSDSVSAQINSDFKNLVAVFDDFEEWCSSFQKKLSSVYKLKKYFQLSKSFLLHKF